jgi:ribulose-5-phosphate 4-epimerase/fuculose-1-phosphate aldolase
MREGCTVKELKSQVLRIAKAAVAKGLAHETAGNFSAIDRNTGLIAITPSAIPRDSCSVDDICTVDLRGNLVDGRHKPSSETPMHTAIYRAIPGVMAIVHTHSPYATAYAVARKEIGPFAIEILKVNGRIPLVPYAIPGSQELADLAAAHLRDYPVVLLENHGPIAIGKDLDQAFLRAVFAEDLAKIGILACTLGGPQLLTAAQLDDIRAFKKSLQEDPAAEIVV